MHDPAHDGGAGGVIAELRARARAYRESFAHAAALEDEWRALDDKTSERALELLALWTRAHVERVGARGLVVGVSGGVDSTLAAVVMQRAVGDAGLALILPARSDPADEEDARALLALLGARHRRIDIAPVVDAALVAMGEPAGDARDLAAGNLACRVRQAVTYFVAARERALVLGTSDLDEAYVGYGCKGSAADVSPLCGLHKDEVRALVRRALAPLDEAVATRLSARRATPGYFPGQDAEEELGLCYREIAAALDVLVPACELSLEGGVVVRDSIALRIGMKHGVPGDHLRAVAALMQGNLHKTIASPSLWRAAAVVDAGEEAP